VPQKKIYTQYFHSYKKSRSKKLICYDCKSGTVGGSGQEGGGEKREQWGNNITKEIYTGVYNDTPQILLKRWRGIELRKSIIDRLSQTILSM
jgi:hypothetical protein